MLPTTETQLYTYMMGIMLAYIAASAITCWFRHKTLAPYIAREVGCVFDAVTFASSVGLLVGVSEPNIIKLFGNISFHLIVAGSIGLLYTIRQPFVTKA